MKKALIITFLSILCCIKTVVLNGQTPEPVLMNGDRGLQKAEIIRLQIKDDLKLGDKKFDSVYAIQREFQSKIIQVRTDKTLTQDVKLKREKELVDLKRKRFKAVGLDDAETKRVEDYFLTREKQMHH